MKAKLIYKNKKILFDGAIIEMVIWSLAEPVKGSKHQYKYRLYFGHNGQRIVGFDNERGKGDHCHFDDLELPYNFISVEKLIKDFLAEVYKRIS